MIDKNSFYTVEDKENSEFYMVPKVLFTLDRYKNLSGESKLLYGLLKDRLNISIKHNWIDENGYVFFNYSRQDIADLLMVSLNTARARFKELKDVGLLAESSSGNGKKLNLYLCKIDTTLPLKNTEKTGSNFEPVQNLTGSKFGLRPVQNLGSSKNNIVRLNIYSHFNSKNIIVHRQLNKNISHAISKALNIYTADEIIKAIDNYAEVYHGESYYKHKWSLDKFLKQDNAISRFTDEGDIWNSYKADKNKRDGVRVNQAPIESTKDIQEVKLILEEDM